MIPVNAGINIEESPSVEKTAPNSAPLHCLEANQ